MASNRVRTDPKFWVVATDPEYVGKIPVRHDIEVLPADDIVWCPLCVRNVRGKSIAEHCRKHGGKNHLALEVLET